MMRTIQTLIAIAALPACTLSDASSFGSSTQYGESLNGESLNGESLNGESLNGESLNGESLNGPNNGNFTQYTLLDSATLNGRAFDSITLEASVFTGMIGNVRFTGSHIAGTHFDAVRGDGSLVTLRITSAVAPTAPSTAWTYYVDYLETDGQWYPTCKSSGTLLRSVALNGRWDHNLGTPTGGSHIDDPTKFTFACDKLGAIAKCVLTLGYEPWTTTANGVSLAPFHQACSRMLRADYCGDGTSYTTNGRLLNLYDDIGIQDDADTWAVEAEWTAAGARCVTSHHRASVAIPCYDPALEADCGNTAHFDDGTLIVDELP